jgi:hypothetical protein
VADYEVALALLGRPMPAHVAGRGLGLGGQMVRQVAYRLLPGHFVGRATAGEREGLLEASRVLEGLSETYYNVGDFLTSFYATMSAFNLAERAGPSPELMRGYANMCATLGIISLNGAADGYRRRALDMEAPSTTCRPAPGVYPVQPQRVGGRWDQAGKDHRALAIYARRRLAALGRGGWLWPQVAQSRANWSGRPSCGPNCTRWRRAARTRAIRCAAGAASSSSLWLSAASASGRGSGNDRASAGERDAAGGEGLACGQCGLGARGGGGGGGRGGAGSPQPGAPVRPAGVFATPAG